MRPEWMMTTSARKSLTATDQKRRCASRRGAPFFHATVGQPNLIPLKRAPDQPPPMWSGQLAVDIFTTNSLTAGTIFSNVHHNGPCGSRLLWFGQKTIECGTTRPQLLLVDSHSYCWGFQKHGQPRCRVLYRGIVQLPS